MSEDSSVDPFEEDSGDADSQTLGLYFNLGIGIPITILCLLLFDPIRRRVPSVFETRRRLHDQRDPLDYLGNRVTTPPAPSYKILGWFLPTLRLDLETITDTHGLDTALFLRYQRLMIALFTAFLFPTLILAPVYLTAGGKAIGINKLSMSNIPQSDGWRFWLTLTIEYFIVAFIFYFIFTHLTLYCRDRRRYRAARHPANYAVLVQDIPAFARSAEEVRKYWEIVFPDQISAVFYVQDARRLEKYKEEFWTTVDKREMAEWRVHDAQNRNLARTEKKNDRLKRRAVRRTAVMDRVSSVVPGDNADLEHGPVHTSIPTTIEVTKPDSAYYPDAEHDARHDERATGDLNDMPDKVPDPKPEKKPFRMSGFSLKRGGPPKDPVAAVEHWKKAQHKEWTRVMAYQSRRYEGNFATTSSAVVVFKSRRLASIAAQTNFARFESVWRVSRAPEPNAINWGALCVTGWSIYLRQAITALLSVSLTLLWVAPVTAIMTVVSITSLIELQIGGAKPFKFLVFLEDMPDFLKGFVESTVPAIVLSLFLSFVPSIFRLFVSISRIVSNAERDRLVRDWYFIFVMFSNFLFVVFAGSILSDLTELAKGNKPPQTVIVDLARNIPVQGAFMMNFIILTALTEVPRELLQLGRILTRAVKLKYFAKTQRQREIADVGEMDMDFVEGYSMSQLVTLLGIVYCTIQPLITVCCLIYFCLSHVVGKYNLLYSFYNEYEDGGRMYGGAIYAVWAGLFVHLVTMIGVFGLNRSLAQSVLIIIPTVVSVLFMLHCRKSFSVVIEHGSALETQDRVENFEGVKEDVIEDELAATYEHPGWEELPASQDIDNLNGVVTEEGILREKEQKQMEEDMRIEELLSLSVGAGTGQDTASGLGKEEIRTSSALGRLPDMQQIPDTSVNTTASSGSAVQFVPGSAASHNVGNDDFELDEDDDIADYKSILDEDEFRT